MSEDFVDVRWRGLEVARKVRLRATGSRGYVEHGTPMPTGTALTVHTADGHTLTAVVAAVHEQVGGRTEPPGMELEVCAEGEAAAWWHARREVAAAAAATVGATAPARADAPVASEARTRTIPPAELAQATRELGAADPGPVGEARPAEEARPTEVMAAVAPPDEAEPEPATAAAGERDAAGTPDAGTSEAGTPEGGPPEAVPVELADDGRHTAVMTAVDIEAIVAAGVAEAAAGDDDAGPANGGDKKKGPRGKRKRGR
jgi:hypothetical protein